MKDLELYRLAVQAAKGAYAPYSLFCVGAALLAADGRVFVGANVENSSYPAGICAERTAAAKAVTEGAREFAAIAVAAPGTGKPAWPCGICRQFLFEFGGDMRVISGTDEGDIEAYTLDELLLNGFGPGKQGAK
jgi:cytidine deaminase